MRIEMRDSRHLWIVFNPQLQDAREVIIDQEKDVRICDGKQIVKVRFTKDGHFIKDILVNDVFVYPSP